MSALAAFQYVWPLLSGFGGGLVFFGLLARTTRLHLAGAPLARLLPLLALRLAVALALFWAVAHSGALPLLLALAGFVLARLAIQRSVVVRP